MSPVPMHTHARFPKKTDMTYHYSSKRGMQPDLTFLHPWVSLGHFTCL